MTSSTTKNTSTSPCDEFSKNLASDKNQDNPYQDPQDWITWFAVTRGGDGPDRRLPITPHANFRTECEAKIFQANALALYPGCKVSKQSFFAECAEDHKGLIKTLFDFTLKLTTDRFSPRAKYGNVLVMRRGMVAEDGDIVAIDRGDNHVIRLEFYVDGMEYFAGAMCIVFSNERLYTDKQIDVVYQAALKEVRKIEEQHCQHKQTEAAVPERVK